MDSIRTGTNGVLYSWRPITLYEDEEFDMNPKFKVGSKTYSVDSGYKDFTGKEGQDFLILTGIQAASGVLRNQAASRS